MQASNNGHPRSISATCIELLIVYDSNTRKDEHAVRTNAILVMFLFCPVLIDCRVERTDASQAIRHAVV